MLGPRDRQSGSSRRSPKVASRAIPAAQVRLKRAYEPAAKDDGKRILVDRLWPRGISKAKAEIDEWLKEIAPSTELRRWFGHDPARWEEFQRRYRVELAEHSTTLKALRDQAREGPVTLVFSAKDEIHNDAVVLRKVVLGRSGPKKERSNE